MSLERSNLDMDLEIEELRRHLRATPAECVQGFQLTPAVLPVTGDETFKTVWSLSCSCGETTGAVLGYPLGRFVADYEGSLVVGPLAFDCSRCGKVTEIIDTDLHGYHSELARLEGGPGSGKFRGEGARDRFGCPQCRETRFSITVAFVYWDAAFDLMMDEPGLAPENLFTVFLSCGVCTNCKSVAYVTDFGKL